ncbi:MAG: hypothetical protein J1E95_08600 [Muribaculaceae bacterium]|nr:hypothetical protein [Muribaculaceae bacterium]
MEKIDLWAAISRMREISAEGNTFSMKFRKWDRQRHHGGELVTINAARIRPKASDEAISNASQKLFFTDTETGRALNCWQILIMEFNGMKTFTN